MIHLPQFSVDQADQLREECYNAFVTQVNRIHEDLMTLRIRFDSGRFDYEPGQYTVLGLGYWERRVPDCQAEDLTAGQLTKLIKRAYSISCPVLINRKLVRPRDLQELEFYITLIRRAASPPALTPRLFALSPGDRLFVGPRAHGQYLLRGFESNDHIIFVATGTGEAPHNAMIAELLSRGHQGKIVSLNCVRFRRDLGYWKVHQELERRFPNYQYIALTTREAENLDSTHPNYIGKQYLQNYLESGQFEQETGIRLSPDGVRVFLCGSPAMIGVPLHTHDPNLRYPTPKGMVEVLESRGFEIDRPHHPGTIHFEKYW